MSNEAQAIPLFGYTVPADMPHKGMIPREIVNRIEFAENGCWLWKGRVNGSNYPYDAVDGKQEYIPIYLYERLASELPKRTNLWRRCENTLCVCPSHMTPGKAVSGLPLSPFTVAFDKREKCYTAIHEAHPNCRGWGDTPDMAVFDCESEIWWCKWLS